MFSFIRSWFARRRSPDPQTETDAEVEMHYLRVIERDELIQIEVCQISWPEAHEPLGEWAVAGTLPISSSTAEVLQAKKTVMMDENFFRRCVERGGLHVRGHMHDQQICQRCAERNHDVTY